MDRFSKLVIVAALAYAGSAHAVYSNLPPPPGFAGTPAGWTFAPSSADDVLGKIMRQSKVLPVPGTADKLSVAYKLGVNAPRAAAAVIFANPYLRAGIAIAGWLGVAKVFYDVADGVWKQTLEGTNDGWIYTLSWYGQTLESGTASSLCASLSGKTFTAWYGTNTVTSASDSGNSCAYYYTSSAGSNYGGGGVVGYTKTKFTETSTQVKPLTKKEFEDELGAPPKLMPDGVPLELPKGTPLPIELPIVNPTPGPNPVPEPKFIPTGEPVPNPKYDPNAAPSPTNKPFIQPGVRVTPKPTPAEPWRVEYQPVDRPQDGAEPVDDPEPTDSKDKPKTDEQQSLCEKHPDIIACQKFDDPKDDDLRKQDRDVSITPDSGWGSENASCPAPKHITVQGRSIAIPYDLFCTYATGMRPIIIAMAWLSAAFILMGARSES